MTNKQAVDRAIVLKMCMRYLEDQNCVLFGEAFDISDDDGLAECANWLTDIILGLKDYK